MQFFRRSPELTIFVSFQGDNILVQPVGIEVGKWFQGFVHVVRKDEVGLRFNAAFKHNPNQRYKIRFKLNRYPLRRQHQALDSALHSDRILFPTNVNVIQTATSLVGTLRIRVYNKLIATNPPQLQAVNTVLNQPPGSPPFVLFGP